MNREDAIEKIINGFCKLRVWCELYPDDCQKEDCEMWWAIEALQNLSKPNNLIKRQDAIDAFGLSEKTRKYGGDHSGYDTMMLYEIQDVLESLPSADCKDCIWDVCNYNRVNWDWEGDAISRQDAIKRFGEDGTWLERQGVTTLTMVEAKQRAVDILESLPSADRSTEWIPCSERLPKENEYAIDVCKYYLIQDEYGDMHVAHLSSRGWETIESIKTLGCDVIAWMPLPEPYREDGESNV